jgi:ubiquitin-conjugating enzyme E2 Z
MPFEGGSNSMHGKFSYKSLDKRIRKIRTHIDLETDRWIQEGKKAYAAGDRAAENLQFQFSQCQQGVSSSGGSSTVTFEMEKDNPFLWTLVTHPRPT